MREMSQFAVVLVVVLLGFTLSFHADTYGQTCLNLFKSMLGEVDFFDEFAGHFEAVATVLLVLYLIAWGRQNCSSFSSILCGMKQLERTKGKGVLRWST